MSELLKILIVEDSEDDYLLIVRELKKGGLAFEHKRADSSDSMRKQLDDFSPDIVLSDYSMPGFSGLDALSMAQDTRKDLPVIIVSGAVGDEKAAELIRTGAYDFVIKNNLMRLVPAVNRAIEHADMRREREVARENLLRLNADLENIVKERTNQLTSTNAQLQEEVEAHKNTEAQLIGTKNFLNAILENIPDVIYVKNTDDMKFTFINKAGEELLGYSREDIIGKNVHELFSKSLAEYYDSGDRMIVEKKKTLDFSEELIKSKNNELKLFFTKKLLINNENDDSNSILTISEDITERKKAEKDLKKHEMRFLRLFKSSPVAIAVFNSDSFDIIDLNKAFSELTGYTHQEAVTLKFTTLGIWDNQEIKDWLVQQTITEGRIENKEVDIISKEGEKKTVLVAMEYLPNDDECDWLIFIAQDITAIKAAEEDIKRSLLKEKDLNFLKTRFISMISHEYRTPLTTIMLSADLLKRYGDQWPVEERVKHFDRIQNTVLRMTQLMENVLTIGRLETGRFEFHPDNIDLPSFCQSIAENVQFSNQNKNTIVFTYNGTCNNPRVDENLLGLIITNLLTNAVKYSPQGKNVEFSVVCNGNEAVFIIRDYGIGIPEDDLKHLFNTFFRASNVGAIEGYGLGLNIVRNCIDAHKGRIEVQSEVNVGTTFTLYIPVNLVETMVIL